MLEWLKTKWKQYIQIVSGQDKNWDGKVDIKDKLMKAKEKSQS